MSKPYRPALRKRLLKHPLTLWVLTGIASVLLRMIYATCRVQKHIPETSAPFFSGERNAIFCFWHGRMILMAFFRPPHRKHTALISAHGDGGVISGILHWFGVGSVRGSTSRGGDKALRELKELADNGINIVITPDGPRGPHQQCAIGPAWLAANTGLPIITTSFSSTHRRHANSWDKFLFPLPFGRVVFMASEPYFVTANDDVTIESARATIEASMNALTDAVDAAVTQAGSKA